MKYSNIFHIGSHILLFRFILSFNNCVITKILIHKVSRYIHIGRCYLAIIYIYIYIAISMYILLCRCTCWAVSVWVPVCSLPVLQGHVPGGREQQDDSHPSRAAAHVCRELRQHRLLGWEVTSDRWSACRAGCPGLALSQNGGMPH